MAKPKETYRETYRAGSMVVPEERLPESLPYMSKEFCVVGMEVRAAGVLNDGREYQDIRVFTKEKEASDVDPS